MQVELLAVVINMSRKIVLVLLLINIVYCCNFNSEQKRAFCTSFRQLNDAGLQTHWEKLVVAPDNKLESVVTKDAFKNAPNVDDLQIKGFAKIINRGVFLNMKRLFQIHLDDNELNQITARNFESPTLQEIYIFNCQVEEVQPKAFENVPLLKRVYIFKNKITTIKKDIFVSKNLEIIFLRNNKIKYVENGAFLDLPNLSFLSLEENELGYFEPQITIGHSPTLRSLYINRNQLSEVKREMFIGYPNLEILLLNINNITEIGEKAFVDLKKLWLLDLSHNEIDDISPNVFPAEGNNIVKLFLHDNKLTFISTGVLVRLRSLRQISATGNPWQCPCQLRFRSWLNDLNITRICDREVKQGERPSCVLHPKNYKECVYDKENAKEVVEYYDEIIKEYPQLPPVCETDGKDVPSLGAK